MIPDQYHAESLQKNNQKKSQSRDDEMITIGNKKAEVLINDISWRKLQIRSQNNKKVRQLLGKKNDFTTFFYQSMVDSVVLKITCKHIIKIPPLLIIKIFQDMFSSSTLRASSSKENNELAQKNIRNSWNMQPPTQHPSLKISNLATRYKLKYGMDFKDLLDSRDQVMEHSFDFSYEVNYNTLQDGQNFLESQLYNQIKIDLKKFLSEAIGNVVSAGFKFLCKKELGEFEAKELAAKNTLLNIYSIHRQTIKSILECQMIKLQENQKELLKEDLILEVNNIVENILINLADSYPQAPISGGTPRMKQVISEINMVDDPEKDFIYLNKIPLVDDQNCEDIFKEEQYDYTRFIMKVLNKVIEMPQDSTEDYKDRTIFEKFRSFNEHLFFLSENKEIKNFLTEKQKIKSTICSNFNQILSNQQVKNKDHEESSEFLKQCWNKYEDVLIALKKNKAYALGQKVPIHVEPFNRLEIEQGKFTSKHSSILRTLTKWVEYLEEIFENPEKSIMTRKYPFVSLDRQLVEPRQNWGSKKLIQQLNQQKKQVRKKFEVIEKESYKFLAEFLGSQSIEEQNFVSSINRFTQTRKISSKTSAVITSLMLSYTNTLIHHLVKAGKGIITDKGIKNINLITFKVSDLMRSKFCCSESGFISLLNIMYLLNEEPQVKKNFSLVRIKNKLNEPANNIIINYLFMGKMQCELQLSIQKPNDIFKNYYTFSHFAYQLYRGKFGVLAECAIMISQLDPMIQACKQNFYQEHVKKRKKQILRENEEQKKKQNQMLKKLQLKPFFCSYCKKLVINEKNKEIKNEDKKCCFSCFKRDDEIKLQEPFQTWRNLMSENRKTSFNQEDKRYLKQKYWVTLDQSGFKVQVIVEIKEEFEIFSILLDEQMLKNIQDIDYNKLNYIKIKKKIKPMIKDYLVYQFEKIQDIKEQILLEALKKDKDSLCEKMTQLIKNFKDFRIQKNMIKNINSKTEILRIEEKKQFNCLEKICSHLTMKDIAPNSCKYSPLKYQKYTKISLSSIKKIKAKNCNIKEIPTFFSQCSFLTVLNLGNNLIKIIKKQDLPSSLVELDLNSNQIEDFDVSIVPKIQRFYKKHNGMKSFEVEKNDSLRFLNLENNHKLKRLNMGDNENLEQLRVSYGSLGEFDMMKNKKLRKLMIYSCKLEKFDMRDNNSLEELDISYNSLKQLDLKKNINLKTIHLKNNSSSAATVKLNENQKLQSIHVEEKDEEKLTLKLQKPCQYIIPQSLFNFCKRTKRLKKAKVEVKYPGYDVKRTTIGDALNLIGEVIESIENENLGPIIRNT